MNRSSPGRIVVWPQPRGLGDRGVLLVLLQPSEHAAPLRRPRNDIHKGIVDYLRHLNHDGIVWVAVVEQHLDRVVYPARALVADGGVAACLQMGGDHPKRVSPSIDVFDGLADYL